MTAGVPYERMKASEVDWLGDVPTHWGSQSLGSITRSRSDKGRTDLPLLSVAREKGVFRRSMTGDDGNHNMIPDDLTPYKVAPRGALVVNKMKAWQGSMGIAPCDGVVSPAYYVFDLAMADSRYAERLLRSKPYVACFAAVSDGVRIGQWDLSIPGMKAITVVIPPADEQAAIVRFLDHAVGRLERAIAAKRLVVRLLEEQRRAIVHRAVTRGLEPHAPMKDSGVPWLGEVPAGWGATRVKGVFQNLNARRRPLSASQRGQMEAPQYDYYGASGKIDLVEDYLFDEPLVLIAEDGANLVLRNLPLAIIATGRYWVNNHAHILRPRSGNIDYLTAYLETINYAPWISGAAQPKLTKDRLMSIEMVVPARDEQNRIMESCSVQTAPLHRAINAEREAIALLEEYKTALIAEAVTGKRDVRAAAARLPDAPPPVADALDFDAGEDDLEEELLEEALA